MEAAAAAAEHTTLKGVACGAVQGLCVAAAETAEDTPRQAWGSAADTGVVLFSKEGSRGHCLSGAACGLEWLLVCDLCVRA
jgi:hypothetical protein